MEEELLNFLQKIYEKLVNDRINDQIEDEKGHVREQTNSMDKNEESTTGLTQEIVQINIAEENEVIKPTSTM